MLCNVSSVDQHQSELLSPVSHLTSLLYRYVKSCLVIDGILDFFNIKCTFGRELILTVMRVW